MRIVGLGIDAAEVPRVEDAIARFGDRFLQRVFTEAEIAYCQRRRRPGPHFAGRFAAKEAGMKAIGTGHSRGVLWRDVEVVRSGGPPRLEFHGAARAVATSLGATRALVTITHTDTLAIAHVILAAD